MKKTIITAVIFLTAALASLGQVTISGHVFNDANGLTDLQINGSGGPLTITNGLNVYLVDTSTNEILQAVHSTFNDYAFYNVPENTTYKLVMSWAVQYEDDICNSTVLPSGWLIVGENLGTGPLSGHDPISNGMLLIDVGSDDIEEANFGIKQYP